jgi:ribonuclease T2
MKMLSRIQIPSIVLLAVSNLGYLQGTNAQNLRQRNDKLKTTANNSSSKNDIASSDFDFYVLSMSFQPEFCFQHKRDSFPGCENPQDFWRTSLTLHGLWPEDYDGSWPSTCTDEEFNPKTVHDLGPDRFDHLWPNVKSSEPSKVHYSFWEHEWTKHGTCTGLSQDEYFDTALKHFLPTPSFVRDNYGLEVSSSDLLKAYREDQSYNDGDIILVCSGGRYLSEVRICVAKDKHGSGSYRIECIDQVVEEGNCGSEITIPKFYIDEEEELELEIKVE